MINIDDLLGVPYKKGGRSYSGMDCIGLVIEVERRFGHEIPDIDEYRKIGALNQFQSLTESTAAELNLLEVVDTPKTEGDILLFENNLGVLHHIGVYMGSGKFIHCNRYGVHIENINQFNDKIGRCYVWL